MRHGLLKPITMTNLPAASRLPLHLGPHVVNEWSQIYNNEQCEIFKEYAW